MCLLASWVLCVYAEGKEAQHKCSNWLRCISMFQFIAASCTTLSSITVVFGYFDSWKYYLQNMAVLILFETFLGDMSPVQYLWSCFAVAALLLWPVDVIHNIWDSPVSCKRCSRLHRVALPMSAVIRSEEWHKWTWEVKQDAKICTPYMVEGRITKKWL